MNATSARASGAICLLAGKWGKSVCHSTKDQDIKGIDFFVDGKGVQVKESLKSGGDLGCATRVLHSNKLLSESPQHITADYFLFISGDTLHLFRSSVVRDTLIVLEEKWFTEFGDNPRVGLTTWSDTRPKHMMVSSWDKTTAEPILLGWIKPEAAYYHLPAWTAAFSGMLGL